MRKYITKTEWDIFFNAINSKKNQCRDRVIFRMMYEHGLRVSELKNIKISDLDMNGRTVFIKRLKNGFSTIHPIQERTYMYLEKWLEQRKSYIHNDTIHNLFISKNGMPLSRQWIYKLAKYYGKIAKLPIEIHPHMLRHGCGYALADQGLDTRLIQDYLGHRNIHHTVRYTASNAGRFNQVWKNQ
ncbi:integrase [Salmonella enterica subsp. enterica serovar Caracas]|nr:integrase [Salmonella enterica subsp. enterica serovar Caracas]